MTNEDAIKYLKQLYPYGGHCWLDEQRTEAIGMAIQALQEEPVSESLEKASTKYAQDKYMPVQTSQAFKAGAQWYKQQMMKNAVDSIVHCDKFGVILPKEDLKKAVDNLPELQVYDKMKLLIIKED